MLWPCELSGIEWKWWIKPNVKGVFYLCMHINVCICSHSASRTTPCYNASIAMIHVLCLYNAAFTFILTLCNILSDSTVVQGCVCVCAHHDDYDYLWMWIRNFNVKLAWETNVNYVYFCAIIHWFAQVIYGWNAQRTSSGSFSTLSLLPYTFIKKCCYSTSHTYAHRLTATFEHSCF